MAQGTIVVAENLFGNIPARKKFLKSPLTELRHSIDTINHFAVAYPSIKFTLTHAKRVILDYPSTEDLSERIEQLIGSETFSFFLPIKKSESYVSLSGFIAKPQINSTTSSKQFLFVNKRKVQDKLIAQAVKESFGTMLEATTYPLFVLFVTVPFEMVDVNVHPRKEQVAFANNQFMYQTIKQLISETLEENNLTFQNLSWKRTGVGMTRSFAGKFLKENVLDNETILINKSSRVFQLNKLYIVMSSKNGLVLVDQHAAHERVLFEKLQQEFIKQKNKSHLFKLPQPVALKLTKSEEVLLKEYKNTLQKLGFLFDKEILTHVPMLFQDRNPHELLQNILEDLKNQTGIKTIDTTSEEMLAFLACRAAVKAGDVLQDEHMRKILSDLDNTQHNTTCPHGRPTRIFISMNELENMFGR